MNKQGGKCKHVHTYLFILSMLVSVFAIQTYFLSPCSAIINGHYTVYALRILDVTVCCLWIYYKRYVSSMVWHSWSGASSRPWHALYPQRRMGAAQAPSTAVTRDAFILDRQ